MCPPLHYEPAAGEDPSAVMAEWRGLYRLLRDDLDVQVDLLEPRPDMPGLVLAAGGGFVWEDSFIASRPRDASRRPEGEAWSNFFLVRGYFLRELPEDCGFDGERDLVLANGKLFAGYRAAADLATHRGLSEMVGQEVHSLRLSDAWPGPLDTCLCPLGAAGALLHPDAFDPASRQVAPGPCAAQLIPSMCMRRTAWDAMPWSQAGTWSCPKVAEGSPPIWRRRASGFTPSRWARMVGTAPARRRWSSQIAG